MKIIIDFFKNIFKFKFSKKNNLKQIAVKMSNDESDTGTDMMHEIKVQMQQDPHKIVMQQSQKHLNDLKIYQNYFNDDLLDKVYMQTQIIHDVFADNKELNHKKLEQFHYYYTVHLMELLNKVKKKQDEKYTTVKSKIKSLKEHITTLKDRATKIESNTLLKQKPNHMFQYAEYMELQICAIYNCLCNNFDDFRFKSRDKFITFTSQYGLDFAWELPMDLFKSITEVEDNDKLTPYKYKNFTFERNLLGKLNKHQYRVKFIGTFKLQDQSDYFELFSISDTADYFLYNHDYSTFKMVNYNLLTEYMIENNTRLGQIYLDIKAEEKDLREYEFKTKAVIDTSMIKDALEKYLEKILDTELMTDYSQIDTHRKNLEAILELERTAI